MNLILRFTEYGKNLEMIKTLFEADGVYSTRNNLGDVQASLNCLLFSPCKNKCSHKHSPTLEFCLNQEGIDWLTELLILAVRYGDQRVQCRAATLMGQIGGARIARELGLALDNPAQDVHWAAVDALRKLGCTDLLAEWNYR